MKVAALADIHGNVQALDAVLADPRCASADEIVVLGDVVAGTFPVECLDRLGALGDRVRMQDHATDSGVFIRSMATRGHLGGLAWATPQAVRVTEPVPQM